MLKKTSTAAIYARYGNPHGVEKTERKWPMQEGMKERTPGIKILLTKNKLRCK